MWKLAVAAGAVAILVVLALVAFGTSSSSLTDPIAKAAAFSSSTPGYQMNMALQITSAGLSTPITATGTGTVDLRDHASSLSLSISAPQLAQGLPGESLRLDMVTQGTTVYMRVPSQVSSSLPLNGKQWIKVDIGKLPGLSGLSSLQGNPLASDPSRILQYLRAESSSVANEGPQVVGGVETTHYQAELDLDHAGAALPSAARGAAQQLFKQYEALAHSSTMPVDVWIDARHLVRRIALNLSLGLPTGQSLTETMTMDLTHYGPQTRPTPPPSGEVQDLSGLLSGSGL